MRLHIGYIKTENKEDFETMLHLPFFPQGVVDPSEKRLHPWYLYARNHVFEWWAFTLLYKNV